MEIEALNEALEMLPTYALRLAVALACGLILGVERERKDKPAGLRTIVLISLGSALFMIVGNLVPFAYDWPDLSRIDPSRVAAGVVTGVGFLGAGTIIQSRASVQGLTTAAVIWVAAGVGMCAGIGYSILAIGFTVVALISLVSMEPLRKRLTRLGQAYDISLVVPNDSLALHRILYVLEAHDVPRDAVDVQVVSSEELQVDCVYYGYAGGALRLLEAASLIDGVRGTRFEQSKSV